MIDIAHQLQAIHRHVGTHQGSSGETVAVVLRRSYDAAPEDVWDALTDPERVVRWFLPVTGDLREGGTFQLEGNAGGDILTCEPPTLLRVTFGAPASIVEVRLRADGDERTSLELEHSVPLDLVGSGAGALYVGPGWDAALMWLARFLAGQVEADPVAAQSSPEAQEFSRGSITEWTAAVEASGTATPEETAAGVAAATEQFSPESAAP